MANQINVIKPYKWSGMWVFDDASVGLEKEPFVAGADTMIDMAIAAKKIADADNGFLAIFSKDPFPGADMVLTWVRAESSGNVYSWQGWEGWLCPALLRYFEKPPAEIHVQIKAAA